MKTPAPPSNPTPHSAIRTQNSAAPDKLGPIVQVKLSTIDPSPFNPRTKSGLNPSEITELANSILQQGIINPLIVRPHPKKKGEFELVCGERRLIAADEAGLIEVPCRAADLSDNDAREIQAIENLQRENLHELEEAQGYADMLALQDGTKPRYTIESLAEKVSTSPSTIRARLKLLAAPKKAREAMLAGTISPSIALHIARIPNDKDATTATEYIISNELSERAVREYINENFMVRLKGCTFDQNDKDLVPKAGSCADCPYRTGNLKKIYPDITSVDVCTNTQCFKSKVKAHADKAIEAAKKDKLTIMPTDPKLWAGYRHDHESKQALRNYGEGAKFIDLDAPCPLPTKPAGAKKEAKPNTVAWRDVLKGQGINPILTLDPENNPRSILPQEDLAKVAKVIGLKLPTPETVNNSSDSQRKQQAEQNRKQKFWQRAQRHIGRELVKACTAAPKASLEFWELIGDAAQEIAGHDTVHEMVNRRQLNVVDGKRQSGLDEGALIEDMKRKFKTEGEWRAYILELIVIRNPRYNAYSGDADIFSDSYKDACKIYGVDIKKLTAEVKAQDEDRTKKVITKKADKKAAKAAGKSKK